VAGKEREGEDGVGAGSDGGEKDDGEDGEDGELMPDGYKSRWQV